MDGATVGILAAVTGFGTLNVATIVIVITMAREVGAIGARVVNLEQGQTAVDQRLTAIEQGQTAMDQRLTVIEQGQTAMDQRLTVIEQGQAAMIAAVGKRMDRFEEGVAKRVADLEVRMTKRSDEIHALAKETRRLRMLVAKALDLPPDTPDNA